MTAMGKVLVSVGSMSESGMLPCREPAHLLIADGIVETFEQSEISVVELRIVLPSRSAEMMLLGMFSGETDIAFTGMSPVEGRK